MQAIGFDLSASYRLSHAQDNSLYLGILKKS